MTDKYFIHAIPFVLQWETGGDLVNGAPHLDPNDPGGFTKWGISKRGHPDVDIMQLSRDQAEAIYLSEYWLADGIQQSAATYLPWPASFAQFDATVNIGNWDGKDGLHLRANKLLQRALGAVEDGIIGPKTRAKVGGKDALELTALLVSERLKRYRAIVRSNPTMNVHYNGWSNRVEDLLIKAIRDRNL